MKRKKKGSKNYSLQTAFIFIVLVFILILISIVFKIILIAGQSKFDGAHRFNVAVFNGSSKISVLSFAPDNHSVSNLIIDKNNSKNFDASKFLGVPMDGLVKLNSEKDSNNFKDIDSQMKLIILNYKNIETNLTIIDFARLWFYARTVSSGSINSRDINMLSKDVSIDKISSSLFSDYTISQEKNTIEIINGTDITGLGNRLARLITNMGGNVISITTSEKPIEKSEVSYFGDKTYTFDKINKVLGYKIVKIEKQGISDITIKIGKDSLSSLKF